MTIDSATYLSISANVTLAVFGVALALLVVWQDPRRRSNQYFGLSMTVFALFGVFNTVWQVPQQFDLTPEPLLYTLSTLYILAIILLFDFGVVFAGLPRRVRQIAHLLSLPLGAGLVALVWAEQVYRDFEPLAGGNYGYTVTPVGLAGVGIVLVYLLTNLALLHKRSPKARELSVPAIVLVLGMIGFAAAPVLRAISINAIAMTVAAVLTGRLVLKYQVFQPLADLNDALAAKNDELLEATQQKSRFLANMSHELRTPLNSIIGYAELVVNRTYGELTDLQEDRLRKVMRNGRLLLDLINDVLDLSKIEAGRLELTLMRVPTAELLDSLLDSFEPAARDKGLMLVRGYGGLPALWVDEDRARQIVANLLSNAVKFTAQGAVIVRGHFDSTQRQVILSITDTGCGIDPANQERVFDAFYRAMTASPQPESSGLGLMIARRLTELHNGRIWFESQVNRGTTFHVALPAAEAAYQPPVIVKPRVDNDGPVILVIDDDCEAVEVVQDHLETANFRVYGACSANDGLKLAHDLRPALIALDVRMPGIDGWQVLEALRRDPNTADIPVLVITATDDRTPADRGGADGFLSKPIQPQDLLAHVQRLLLPAQNRPETEP